MDLKLKFLILTVQFMHIHVVLHVVKAYCFSDTWLVNVSSTFVSMLTRVQRRFKKRCGFVFSLSESKAGRCSLTEQLLNALPPLRHLEMRSLKAQQHKLCQICKQLAGRVRRVILVFGPAAYS